jgi:hypothetical protein
MRSMWWYFFHKPAGGGGTDVLTPLDITSGVPTLATPAIGQVHVLTGSAITSGTPTLAKPVIGQIHVLIGGTLTSGTPTLATPAIGQKYVLAALGITSGTPTLAKPAIGQVHILTGTTVTSGTPTLATPAIGQKHALTGGAITSGTPTLSTPTIGMPGSWEKSKADALATSEVMGVVESVDGDTFVLVLHGKITLSGLTAGSDYFVSPSTAGLLTKTRPTAAGHFVKPVLRATSETEAYVNIMRETPATFTDANWTDLTDGGESALHTHATPVHTHANGLMTVDVVATDFTVPSGNTAIYNNMQVPPARTVTVAGLLVNPGWS